MEILWAPWRMPFIQRKKKGDGESEDCIFCKVCTGDAASGKFVLARSSKSVALLNIFPYNNGHLMVAPVKHTGIFSDITGPEWQDVMGLLGLCQRALDSVFAPQGYNVGINLGRAGGAGIEDHLHVHLVPRWNGDSNFMPVLAATKVLPQALSESCQQIRDAIMKIKSKEGNSHGRKRTSRI